jgi:hypothetical protein
VAPARGCAVVSDLLERVALGDFADGFVANARGEPVDELAIAALRPRGGGQPALRGFVEGNCTTVPELLEAPGALEERALELLGGNAICRARRDASLAANVDLPIRGAPAFDERHRSTIHCWNISSGTIQRRPTFVPGASPAAISLRILSELHKARRAAS